MLNNMQRGRNKYCEIKKITVTGFVYPYDWVYGLKREVNKL